MGDKGISTERTNFLVTLARLVCKVTRSRISCQTPTSSPRRRGPLLLPLMSWRFCRHWPDQAAIFHGTDTPIIRIERKNNELTLQALIFNFRQGCGLEMCTSDKGAIIKRHLHTLEKLLHFRSSLVAVHFFSRWV